MNEATALKILKGVSRSGSTAAQLAYWCGYSDRYGWNDIQKHLKRMVAGRLLTRTKEPREGRTGRPAWVYHLTPQSAARLALLQMRENLERMEQTWDLGEIL